MSPAAANRTSGDGASDESAFWRQLFGVLAKRYGWTPGEISQLTIAQLLHFAELAGAERGERQSMTRGAAMAAARANYRRRETALAELHKELFDEP